MNEGVTEPLEPYSPDDSYDWDQEEEPRRGGPNVLWGRVVILGAALLIAFFVGRASAPSGVSKSALDNVKAQLSNAQKQIQTLQAQAAAAQSASPAPSGSASPSATPAAAAGSQTYTVKPGDTLRGIAQKFYGDSSLASIIEQANNITDPSQLRSGETITIPPKP